VQRITKALFYAARLVIAIAMLWYLASVGSIEWSSFYGLARVWQYTVVAIVLFVVATALQALRLRWLINAHRLELSTLAAIRLTFIGVFFSTYLPGAAGGDLVKIYYASKGNPGARAEVITILLLDRLIGFFTLLTLPLLLAPFFLDLITAKPALQALLGASLIIAAGAVLASVIGTRFGPADSHSLRRIEGKFFFGRLLARILHTLHSYRSGTGVIRRALLISYAVQILMVGVAMAIAQATNPTGADPRMLVLIPMGYLANSLPITPGGLGVGEAAMESLFAISGLSGGAETILGWRIVSIIVGFLGLVFYLKGEKRFVFDRGTNESSNA
jgi:uncharacterized protein (TIRG00374 family)